jgi:hypothetical protein
MYYRKTFRATPNEGDSATLSFRGTGIWIYGSKRYNHGMYEINLDGDKSTLNGMGEDEFGSVLFGREGLDSNADHTIVSLAGSRMRNGEEERAKGCLDMGWGIHGIVNHEQTFR